jgi:regulator of RNase E activity RraA
MPVQIGECIINNRDIIFGDEDGVVCIPSHLWDIILNKALNTIKIESHIKIDTMLGEPINNILSSRGVF